MGMSWVWSANTEGADDLVVFGVAAGAGVGVGAVVVVAEAVMVDMILTM
jgi:hypothetical protein